MTITPNLLLKQHPKIYDKAHILDLDYCKIKCVVLYKFYPNFLDICNKNSFLKQFRYNFSNQVHFDSAFHISHAQ